MIPDSCTQVSVGHLCPEYKMVCFTRSIDARALRRFSSSALAAVTCMRVCV